MFSENYLVLFAPRKVFYFYVISQISRAKHSKVDICHAHAGQWAGAGAPTNSIFGGKNTGQQEGN